MPDNPMDLTNVPALGKEDTGHKQQKQDASSDPSVCGERYGLVDIGLIGLDAGSATLRGK